MTTNVILVIGILLIIVGFYWYKKPASKFEWVEIEHLVDETQTGYSLEYKFWSADIFTDSDGKITVYPYRGLIPLFRVENCPSIEWAKEKAEQVILQDEKKQKETLEWSKA